MTTKMNKVQRPEHSSSPESADGDISDPVFWDIDEMPETTLRRELAQRGQHFPAPRRLSDKQLPEVLWRLIRCLADMHVFIFSTDHLSDRQLYSRLWHRELPMKTWLPCQTQDDAMHMDLLGGCSDRDTHLYLKHYASEADRKYFATEFPCLRMPPHADPPYARDRLLPQREELTRRLKNAG